MKHVQACLCAGKDLITTLKACLSGREDPESSFHHCGGPVRLVQTCLCAGKTFQRRFNLRGGAVKHLQVC